jgi:hypothetical protein
MPLYGRAGRRSNTKNDSSPIYKRPVNYIQFTGYYRLSLLEVESEPEPVPVVSVGVVVLPGLLIVVSVVVVPLGVVVSVPVEEPGVSHAQSDPATKAIKRMLFIVFNFVLIIIGILFNYLATLAY